MKIAIPPNGSVETSEIVEMAGWVNEAVKSIGATAVCDPQMGVGNPVICIEHDDPLKAWEAIGIAEKLFPNVHAWRQCKIQPYTR